MRLEELLARVVSALERVAVPYMLTGSVAGAAHGVPRSTLDLDVVIAPTRAELEALLEQFPGSEYYADKSQAHAALASRGMFNIIDFASGWKVDFIIAADSPYARTALGRRRQLVVAGQKVYVAAPEDVLIAKLDWALRSGSERQLADARGIITTQGDSLDLGYIEEWVGVLGLGKPWLAVRRGS